LPITRAPFVPDSREPSSRNRDVGELPVMETRASRPVFETEVVGTPHPTREKLVLASRERRGEATEPQVGPPANRQEQKPLPFPQRVRRGDLKRWGVV